MRKLITMNTIKTLFLSLILLVGTTQVHSQTNGKAQEVVDRAIKLSGGELYKKSQVSFTFRTKRHFVEQNDLELRYGRTFIEEGDTIKDELNNNVFKRYVNGKDSGKSKRQLSRAFEDVNAVSYFAMLPYKLNDAAVIKEYLGEVNIKGKPFDKVKVTFQGEQSGDSPDNVFYYWFDQETGFMDYLAYTKGGNRFRAAYNQRVVNGILFADYVNYSGGEYTANSAEEYDQLYNADKLKELSRIILEDVEVKLKN